MEFSSSIKINGKEKHGTVVPSFLERVVDRNMGSAILGKIDKVVAVSNIQGVLFEKSPPDVLEWEYDAENDAFVIYAKWVVTAETSGNIDELVVSMEESIGGNRDVSEFENVGSVAEGTQYIVEYRLVIWRPDRDNKHSETIKDALAGVTTDTYHRIIKAQLYDSTDTLIKELTNIISTEKYSGTENSKVYWAYKVTFRDETDEEYTVAKVIYKDENDLDYVIDSPLDVTKVADDILEVILEIKNEAYQSA